MEDKKLYCESSGRIKILYPLFANTYLLPYYATKKRGEFRDYTEIRVEKTYWEPQELAHDILGKERKEELIVFYASPKLLELTLTVIEKESGKGLEDDEELIKAGFTLYIPRTVYIPFSIELFRRYYKGKGLEKNINAVRSADNADDLRGLIPNFSDIKNDLAERYGKVTFFSDTKDEKDFLASRLGIRFRDGGKPTLKCYYYSAPYSIYIFNQYPEYLPILIDLDLEKDPGFRNVFETNNYIYCPGKGSCSLRNKCKLKRSIEQFHKRIFDEARLRPNAFYDLFQSFISLDALRYPFQPFRDVNAFVKAITFHHKYNTKPKDDDLPTLLIDKVTSPYKDGYRKGEEFNRWLQATKELIYDLFTILVVDFLCRDNKIDKKDKDIYQWAAVSLVDKAFLSGKYYFLIRNLIAAIYFYFHFNTNILEASKIREAARKFDQKEIFSSYYEYFFNDLEANIPKLREAATFKKAMKIKESIDDIEKFLADNGAYIKQIGMDTLNHISVPELQEAVKSIKEIYRELIAEIINKKDGIEVSQASYKAIEEVAINEKGVKKEVSMDAIRILFLSADPTDAGRLRLGEELREIQEKLQLAKLRDRFVLDTRMSIRPGDISQALLDKNPKIVHFSGHGTRGGELCFETVTGETQPVTPDALSALFEQFVDKVDCVVLNACFSETHAKAISQHINYVVGMNQAIGDKAAIAFAIGFYQALGGGRTFEDSYKLGCAQIRLQGIAEALTPVLIKREKLRS